MPERLGEPEGKERDDGGDLLVGADAKNGIPGTDDARAEQRTGDGEEAGVRGDELVTARQANNPVDSGFRFAFAVDLGEQCVDAGLCPDARKLGMREIAGRERGLSGRAERYPVPGSAHCRVRGCAEG